MWQSAVVFLIILGAALYVGRRLWRSASGGGACGCGGDESLPAGEGRAPACGGCGIEEPGACSARTGCAAPIADRGPGATGVSGGGTGQPRT